MPYPSHADYDLAVRYIGRFVFDPVLKAGTPRSRNGVAVDKGGEPLCYPGGFAKVYKIDCGSRTYALRVWLHEISDAAKRYHATTQFLKKHALPFFVEHFEFVAGGILVQGKRYPILRMEWVEGYSLRDFIKLSLNQADLLRTAAESFAAMVAVLHTKSVAHGDLQSENVLLRASNGTVSYKLIDYDTLVVPALLGEPTASTGLASYQHPNRTASTTATEKDDYFSELVIYICLLALSKDPYLWAEFPESGRDKELLFEAADFAGAAPSALFQRLYRLGGNVKNLAVVLWNFSRCPSIQLLLPLEKVIELASEPTTAPAGNGQSGGNRSPFDALLKQKLNEKQARGDGPPESWLDDSSFRPSQKRAVSNESKTTPTEKPSPSGTAAAAANFGEVMARMQKTSTAPAVPTPPVNNTSGLGTTFIIIVSVIFLVVALSKCQDDSAPTQRATSVPHVASPPEETRNSPNVPQPSTRQSEPPTVAPIPQSVQPTTPIPQSVQPTTPIPQSISDRLLRWREDLKKRQRDNEAAFARLTKRFNRGVLASEVEGYNAEVRAAKRERAELEVEINEFKSGRDAPARYH